jgi:hypothetical protein
MAYPNWEELIPLTDLLPAHAAITNIGELIGRIGGSKGAGANS